MPGDSGSVLVEVALKRRWGFAAEFAGYLLEVLGTSAGLFLRKAESCRLTRSALIILESHPGSHRGL